jgi:hypothetical protein
VPLPSWPALSCGRQTAHNGIKGGVAEQGAALFPLVGAASNNVFEGYYRSQFIKDGVDVSAAMGGNQLATPSLWQ